MKHRTYRLSIFIVLFLSLSLALIAGCGDDDDDDDDNQPADDDTGDDDTGDDDTGDDDTGDDDTGDDDTGDDDTGDDDTGDDDTGDDDTVIPDDFIASWPQENIEEQDYNEVPTAGYLREKADAYDDNHVANHQPFYGGAVHARFTDETRTVVQRYGGYGDSTIWTGTYLASQALRYWVTGDAESKVNAIKEVNALSGHLHVTGREGFLARYWAPQDPTVYYGDEWCAETGRCHNIEEGEYAGDFWCGETSRD